MDVKKKVQGFFSYVRQNDKHSGGSLTLIRKSIEAELWEQFGEPIEVFQDQEDILWGELWKKKIINSIASSSFFIAIITPSYLKSEPCRFELEQFLKIEKLIGSERILPLIYIDTPELKKTKEPVFAELNNRQWFDWTNRRFSSLTSSSTRKQISKLTREINRLITPDLSSSGGVRTNLDIPNSVLKTATPLVTKKVTIDDMPSPPNNFPDGWDNEWQPSFDKAAIAAKPVPKLNSNPPLVTRAVKALANAEVLDPAEDRDEAFIPSLYVPLAKEIKDGNYSPRQITIFLRATGDKERDRRRIKTLYGTLISYHGRDKFSFEVISDGKNQLIDFPNDTTRICPELLERLKKLMGEENWRVEEITFQ